MERENRPIICQYDVPESQCIVHHHNHAQQIYKQKDEESTWIVVEVRGPIQRLWCTVPKKRCQVSTKNDSER